MNRISSGSSSSSGAGPIISSDVENQSKEDSNIVPWKPNPEESTIHNNSRARTKEGLDLPEKLQQSRLQHQADTLGVGSRGPEVLKLQLQLNEWRVANGKQPIAEDQVFGQETEAAVLDFQKSTGLTADGLAGPQVKARLVLEKDPDFKRLDPSVQQKVCDQFIKTQSNPIARQNLQTVYKNAHFQNLSPESQKLALAGLAENPKDPVHASNVQMTMKDADAMEHDPAFEKLPKETQRDLRRAMFRNCDSPGSTELFELSRNPAFVAMSREEQSKTIGIVYDNAKKQNGETVPTFMSDVINSRTWKTNANPAMRNTVLDSAKEAAPDQDKMRQLTNLLDDPKFANAPAEDQYAMLAALRMKSGLQK